MATVVRQRRDAGRIPALAAGLFGIALATWVPPVQAATPAVDGVWVTEKAEARIRIAPCGAAQCGTIVGLKQPLDPDTGKPATDINNPDPTKRQRPLIGLTILEDLVPQEDGSGWKGRVYNSENGETYDVTLTLEGPDRLHVEGCLLVLCSGETWRRVEEK
jgi:uncharacterized protein (DUF2147 family)